LIERAKLMSQGGDSSRAVIYALGANFAIAIAKYAAAAITGSGSMLAEAVPRPRLRQPPCPPGPSVAA
jgi:hypothetical protein